MKNINPFNQDVNYFSIMQLDGVTIAFINLKISLNSMTISGKPHYSFIKAIFKNLNCNFKIYMY